MFVKTFYPFVVVSSCRRVVVVDSFCHSFSITTPTQRSVRERTTIAQACHELESDRSLASYQIARIGLLLGNPPRLAQARLIRSMHGGGMNAVGGFAGEEEPVANRRGQRVVVGRLGANLEE